MRGRRAQYEWYGPGRHRAASGVRRPRSRAPPTGSGRRPGVRVSVLEMEDIDVTYERRDHVKLKAVVGASLAVERGQIVGLVGESGCG